MSNFWKLFTDRGRQVWLSRSEFLSSPPSASSTDFSNQDENENGEWVDIDKITFDKTKNKNASDAIYRAQCANKAGAFDGVKSESELEQHFNNNNNNKKSSSSSSSSSSSASSSSSSSSSSSLSSLSLSSLSLSRGVNQFAKYLMNDGHFPGDYGGPLFLIPGFVFTMYATCTPISPLHSSLLLRYLLHHQHAEGGWGTHIESPCTQFGSVLNYVAARMLGLSPESEEATRARECIKRGGGGACVPAWGKFWLAVLSLYKWEGMHSLAPELWITPEFLPVHPSRWWCHCRMVYLPMAYIYGVRFSVPVTALISDLRLEIYAPYSSSTPISTASSSNSSNTVSTQLPASSSLPYSALDFRLFRDSVAATDVYVAPSRLLSFTNKLTAAYEWAMIGQDEGGGGGRRGVGAWLRKKALTKLIDYIKGEDVQTRGIDIGPVSKFINMLSIYHADGPDSVRFQTHVRRCSDYLWLSEDGMKIQGYNGSQLWDTAFAAQAFSDAHTVFQTASPTAATGIISQLKRMYAYLDVSQVRDDVVDRNRFYRHQSAGGWPFSTVDHGWPITDCTAEGLKAAIRLNEKIYSSSSYALAPLSPARLFPSVLLLLSFQNGDGSFSTYELQRGSPYLELLNPASVFGGIMVDYGYVECTSACVQALCAYRKRAHSLLAHAVSRDGDSLHDHGGALHILSRLDSAVSRAMQYIVGLQREDGSFYGSWAICFTYGTWFAVEAADNYLKVYGGEKEEEEEGAREKRKAEKKQSTLTLALAAACRRLLSRAGAFLLSIQRVNSNDNNSNKKSVTVDESDVGAWGESFECCVLKRYVPSERGQVVNTAWAVMSLLLIYEHTRDRTSVTTMMSENEGGGGRSALMTAIELGVRAICGMQRADGDWPQQNISGVFNNNCMITYINYRNIFPIWALARYHQLHQALANTCK